MMNALFFITMVTMTAHTNKETRIGCSSEHMCHLLDLFHKGVKGGGNSKCMEDNSITKMGIDPKKVMPEL